MAVLKENLYTNRYLERESMPHHAGPHGETPDLQEAEGREEGEQGSEPLLGFSR